MARKRSRLRNHDQEMRIFRARTWVAGWCCVAALLLLFGRMVWLQVFLYEDFSLKAQDNRVRVRPVAPTRGLIFDRNGTILADNLPSYQLEVTPEKVKDREAMIEEINQIIPITEREKERFNKALRRQRRGSYKGVPLKFKLTDEQVASFAVNQHRFPGVEIQARLNRFYPEQALAVHTIGYVGRVDEKDLSRLDERNYKATTHTGKLGIERYYEDILHGTVGDEQVEVNVQGRVLRVLEQTPPKPGADIFLTLDTKLQKVAEEAFGENAGAIVAMEPKSGEVLVLASLPTYDGNLFVNGISIKDYSGLRDGEYRPLFNRALTGQYPPGSTVKPFVGLGAVESGLQSLGKKVACIGYYQLPNDDHRYRDWKKEGHGKVDLNDSIEMSCDVFYYDLAYRWGIDRMHKYLDQFGFGKRFDIDTLGEKPGILPSSAWKRKARNQPWYPGETLIAGIGQGYFLATPLQLAVTTSALANNGTIPQPHLLKRTIYPDGTVKENTPPPRGNVPVKQSRNWKYIRKAMKDVVHAPQGTARSLGWSSKYKMAAKTGTAQVFSIKQDEEYDEEKIKKKLRDHALFISWAPVDDPAIVVAVIVENGGSGGTTAGPIAKAVMDAHLLDDNGKLKEAYK